MKLLRSQVFEVLDRMSGKHYWRQADNKNNNLVRELKASVSFCLNSMAEVSGLKLGRRRNAQKAELQKYENIAYDLAHQYTKYLEVEDKSEIFAELMSAGMEGLSQGLIGYNPTKKAKLSTFLYSRAQFAIQKQFAQITRQLGRTPLSIDCAIEGEDDEMSLGRILPANNGESAETVAERRMEMEALDLVMQHLPEKDRAIVLLCSEQKPNDVAKQLGMPMPALRTILDSVKGMFLEQMHNLSCEA